MSKQNQTILIVVAVAAVGFVAWKMYQQKNQAIVVNVENSPAPGAAEQQAPQNSTIAAITGSVEGVAGAWNELSNLF